jgi:hypothetical protein
MMYQKQKGLAMNSENLGRTYFIENKIVSLFVGEQKKGGKKVPQQNLWVDCGSGRAPRVW